VQAKGKTTNQGAEPTRKAANTAEVLGPAGVDYKIPAKWKSHYARLEELREHLLHKKNDLSEDARQELPSVGMHMADAGTDSYDRDWALGMLSSEQDALYQVEQAMDRIHNGTFGTCELTGKPIEPSRLDAIPWTRFSADAVRELERNGLSEKAHLGELGSVAAVSRAAERESSPDRDDGESS
jgi:RNA polymerase-binding transcription factor DksA